MKRKLKNEDVLLLISPHFNLNFNYNAVIHLLAIITTQKLTFAVNSPWSLIVVICLIKRDSSQVVAVKVSFSHYLFTTHFMMFRDSQDIQIQQFTWLSRDQFLLLNSLLIWMRFKSIILTVKIAKSTRGSITQLNLYKRQ